MKLTLKRIAKRNTYTIGRLYVDGVLFCDVLEDKDRNLKQNTPLNEINKVKVPSQTAIPTGTYEITLNVISPKFSQKQFYKDYANGGRLPRLINVPGFEGILIHVGDGPNGARLSSGCILVGKNTIVGGLSDGKETFKKLYQTLQSSNDKIIIEIC